MICVVLLSNQHGGEPFTNVYARITTEAYSKYKRSAIEGTQTSSQHSTPTPGQLEARAWPGVSLGGPGHSVADVARLRVEKAHRCGQGSMMAVV